MIESSILKYLKKLALEFFILIFILGFFSKTVADFILPDIHAFNFSENHEFRKTLLLRGTMEPIETFRVIMNEDIVIEEFLVAVGDTVEVGDPIFRVNKSFNSKPEINRVKDLELAIKREKLQKERLAMDLKMREREIIRIKQAILNEENNLEAKKQLYEAGSVPHIEILRGQDSINQLEDILIREEASLVMFRKEMELQFATIDNNIESIRKEISISSKINNFYSVVNNDGVFYSTVDGVVLSISYPGQILRRETLLAEIAKIKGYESVKFQGYIHDSDISFVQVDTILNITDSANNSSLEATISNVSRVSNNNMVRVEAVFNNTKKIKSHPLIGSRLEGRIERVEKRPNIVPKSSVIPRSILEEGRQGVVYVIEERRGVLGVKHSVKEHPVTILAVGDNRVEVSSLPGDANYVITNLSYKIRDGVRVNWRQRR